MTGTVRVKSAFAEREVFDTIYISAGISDLAILSHTNKLETGLSVDWILVFIYPGHLPVAQKVRVSFQAFSQ